jgi:uncharacterized protein
MQTKFAATIFLCVAAFTPLAGNAASFDCGRAVSDIEKLVCSDAELSKLDDALGETYREAFTQSGKSKSLILTQRQWLAQRNACRDRECLVSAYSSRLMDLQNGQPVPETINCDFSVGAVDIEHCSELNSRATPNPLLHAWAGRGLH